MGYRKNIFLLNWFSFLRYFAFWLPVDQFFINEIGGDEFTLALSYGAWALAVIISEVPSGYLADRFGRKTAFYCGQAARIAGYAVIVIFQTVPMYLVGRFLFGISLSASSGADSALLHETLTELDETSKYKKYAGRMTAFTVLGALAGGPISFLLSYLPSYAYHFGFSLIPQVLALYFVKQMVEPPRVHTDASALSKETTRKVLRLFTKKNTLVFLVCLVALAELFKRAGIGFGLSLLEENTGWQRAAIAIWTLGSLSRAVASWLAHRNSVTIETLVLSSVALFAAMSFAPNVLVPVFYVLCFVPIQLALIENENMIQKFAPKELRATTLSVVNFVIQFVVTIPILFMGAFTVQTDIVTMFRYCASFGALLAVLLLIGMRLKSRHEEND